jgi:hypothetical protein
MGHSVRILTPEPRLIKDPHHRMNVPAHETQYEGTGGTRSCIEERCESGAFASRSTMSCGMRPACVGNLREPIRLLSVHARRLGVQFMADDLKDRGVRDRSRVNVHEDYEVRYGTEKWGITKEQLVEAVHAAGVF